MKLATLETHYFIFNAKIKFKHRYAKKVRRKRSLKKNRKSM